MRYSFFWDVTQRRLEVIYLWFGTAPRFHLQGPSSPRTVSLHWVTFQNSKDLSLGPQLHMSLGVLSGRCKRVRQSCLHQDSILAACTESLCRLSYPGTWIYGRRMKYEFGALQKQIFILEGGGAGPKYFTRNLLSIFALHAKAKVLKTSL